MKCLVIARQALECDNNTPSEKIYARICEATELERVKQEMERLDEGYGVEIYDGKLENFIETQLMLEIW